MLRVLLVEDSQVLTERLTETLAPLVGIELVAAVADEAAAVGLAADGKVDVIILDLQLKRTASG
jgi:CheY-like chemotaxis protein